jgi:opacity protein-like surface antigen
VLTTHPLFLFGKNWPAAVFAAILLVDLASGRKAGLGAPGQKERVLPGGAQPEAGRGWVIQTGASDLRAVARWLAAIAGTAVVAVGRAADQDAPLLLEVAGFGSLGVGGQFRLQDGGAGNTGTGDRVSLSDHGAFALAAGLRLDEATWYELFYSREATDLSGDLSVPRTGITIEYLHLGGTVLLNDEVQIKPYMVGGLGVTRFTPGEAGSTDTRFSASLGLGLRWPVTRHFSVRVEGRAFVTLVNDNSAIFCKSDESGLLCRIHGNGQTFVQGELLAGAAFAF